MSSTLLPSVVSPLEKHTASALAVKYLQSIPAASVGSSKQQGGGVGGQREDVCFKK